MKMHNIFATIAVLIVIAFGMGGCSSTSEDGSGDGGSSVLILSSVSALPGEYITVSHDSLTENIPVVVTWSDGQGYLVQTEGFPMVNNEMKIPVPTYVNLQSNALTDGNVTLSVSGISEIKSFNIYKPVTIVYEEGDKPGALMIESMNRSILTLNNTLVMIEDFGIDTADTQANLTAEISRLEDTISEFEATDTFTLYLDDGTTHTLSDQELREGDSLLYTTALGMLEVYDELTSSASASPAVAPILRASSFEELYNGALPIQQQTLDIVREWGDKLEGLAQSAIDNGSTILVSGVTVVTGIAVLAGTITASSALVIGGLTALGYVVITGTLSEGIAALTHKIKESTLTTSNYEFGAQLIEKSKDAAVNLALSLGSAGTELVGGLAELAYSGWSMFTSKIESVCSAPEESESVPEILSSTAISDEEQFCSEIEIIVLIKDSFVFSINIPGYTGPFNKERIAFGLGTITENDVESPPTYPAVAAISTTSTEEFDPLNDEFISLMFSIYLSEGNYTVDDAWITDGGPVDVTFSSGEILEDISTGYKWPVAFTQTEGNLTLEYYGTSYGDRLKGSFSVTVEGDKTTCFNAECDTEGEDYTVETITGTISGTFDGYIKEDPAASSSVSLSSSLIKK